MDNLTESIGLAKDLLRSASLAIAREQEVATKVCGKGILYKLKAMFSKKVFLEHQICMNNAVIKSFDTGISILQNGKNQYKGMPEALEEIEEGITLFSDLKEQWINNLRRLRVYQNTL